MSSDAISPLELKKNYYFCGGSYKHVFEYGRTKVDDWRGRTEEEVLFDRVLNGVKPVASIPVQSAEKRQVLCQKAKDQGLNFKCNLNFWGVHVLYITNCPNKTMSDLLKDRCEHVMMKLSNGLQGKCVRDYMDGFDCFFGTEYNNTKSITKKVSVLESALLLGYPLRKEF